MTRVGEATVALLLGSGSSIVLYCPRADSSICASPVEVGPSELSPVAGTTALEFPSVSVPVETGITEASHAACSKSVVGVTSQHILYYCTYYSVSFTCTVHYTYYTYCTLYTQYMFPVSLFPMLRFHLQHLFTTLVHLHISSLFSSLQLSDQHSLSYQ